MPEQGLPPPPLGKAVEVVQLLLATVERNPGERYAYPRVDLRRFHLPGDAVLEEQQGGPAPGIENFPVLGVANCCQCAYSMKFS